MNPQPSKFKKFLLPLVVIIIIVIGGVFLFKAKATNQGAALYKAVSAKTVTQGSMGSVSTGGTPLNCFAGSTTPQVKVMSPNGGETFVAGQQVMVKWTSCNAPVSQNIRIDVTMSISGGNSVGYSPAQSVPNTGSATITLPTVSIWNQMVYGNNFKITLTPVNANPPFIMDESDNLFTINATSSPMITLLSTNTAVGTATVNNTGSFSIRFRVDAGDSPIYMSSVIQNAVAYAIDRSGVTTTGGISAAFINITDHSVDNGVGLYEINPGVPETFELVVTASVPTSGAAGLYRLSLMGIKWGTDSNDNTPNNTYSNLSLFKTPYQFIN